MGEQFMKIYSNSTDVIYDLHKEGFTNDFILFGNDLRLVEENRNIKLGEFAIVKYHKIRESRNGFQTCIVLGIVALYHNLKGIFLVRIKHYANDLPPVLIKKLQELNEC